MKILNRNMVTILKKVHTDGLGEALRTFTFVGDGYGCYENFDVRPDATPLSEEQLKTLLAATTPRSRGWSEEEWIAEKQTYSRCEGYSFKEGNLTIEAFWFWDGDGTLYFRVKEGDTIIREIVNRDCKNDHEWVDITPE